MMGLVGVPRMSAVVVRVCLRNTWSYSEIKDGHSLAERIPRRTTHDN